MGGLFSTALHSTPLLTSPEWPDSRCAVSRRSQVPDGGDGGGEPEGLGGVGEQEGRGVHCARVQVA